MTFCGERVRTRETDVSRPRKRDPELFSPIDQRYMHWVYLSDNQRMDVVIFWQGIQADAERRKVAADDESRSETETA